MKKIGFDSLTTETNVTKRSVALLDFFNNCMLNVLIGANFEFTNLMFNGKYSDFNRDWFVVNGKIIVTNMLTQIFIPIVNLLLVVIWARILAVKDQMTLRPAKLPN